MAQGCQNLVPLQVGRYLGCTGRGANAVRKAARDPKRGSRRAGQPVHVGWQRPPFCSAGIGVVSAAGLERSSSRKHEDSLTAARHF
jgi:hypothetical protein